MAAALIFAVALSMVEIHNHGLKPQKNKWVLLFLAYLPIHIYLAPAPTIDLGGMPVYNFWCWRPSFKILCFGLLFFTISSHTFLESEYKKVLKTILWVTTIVALYHVAQFFYTDQFMKQCADGDWGRIGGFINNPVLTAPFVAIGLPIAIYFKDWLKATVIAIGVIIPDCQIAWIAAVFSVLIYLALKNKKTFIIYSSIFISACALFSFLYFTNVDFNNKFDDHERFHHWAQIFKDWTGALDARNDIMNIFSLTGRGIGSFLYVYHIEHPGGTTTPNGFYQAHNDLLELGYTMGFVGLFLFIAALFLVLTWIATRHLSMPGRAIFASLCAIFICAQTGFVLQIGSFCFYAVVLAGLLHNPSVYVFKKSIPAS